MTTSYTMPAEEMNEAFLQTLRKTFSGKKVTVTVSDAVDLEATEYPINPKVKNMMGLLPPDLDTDAERMEYLTKKHLQ